MALEPQCLVELMALPQTPTLTLTLTLPRSVTVSLMNPACSALWQVPVRRRDRFFFQAFPVLILFRVQHTWLMLRVRCACFRRYHSTTSNVAFTQSKLP